MMQLPIFFERITSGTGGGDTGRVGGIGVGITSRTGGEGVRDISGTGEEDVGTTPGICREGVEEKMGRKGDLDERTGGLFGERKGGGGEEKIGGK
jgi:hypothetical protein